MKYFNNMGVLGSCDINIHKSNKAIVIFILQIATLLNAKMLGWEIKKIGQYTYELSKPISELANFDFASFMNQIVSFKVNNLA